MDFIKIDEEKISSLPPDSRKMANNENLRRSFTKIIETFRKILKFSGFYLKPVLWNSWQNTYKIEFFRGAWVRSFLKQLDLSRLFESPRQIPEWKIVALRKLYPGIILLLSLTLR